MDNKASFQEIKSDKDFNRICLHNFDKLFVVLFYAGWHEPSVHLINVCKSLAKLHENKCIFLTVDADAETTLPDTYKVELVPTILFMKSTKEIIFRLESESPQTLSQKVEEYLASYKISFEAQKTKMFAKLDELVKSYPLMIFIKGTPQAPECGFSEQLVNALNELKIKYNYFNILADEEVRNWLRYYSNWITYPQVYVDAKFVGGLDVTKDLIKQGKFQELIANLNIVDTPENVVKRLVESANVVAIIEGTVTEPRTLKTEEMLRVLNENGIRFASFNIDDASDGIKEHLKTKYNIIEFPYLIVTQKPVGDLKQVQELSQKKELKPLVPKDDLIECIDEKLKELINSSPVMIFMKGVPDAPQCGFSSKMIAMLNKHNVNFGYFNILQDKIVRERLKDYSNWKTYPQLYIDGKLIGGIDIVNELDGAGEFAELVENYVK